jgi:hypothetical protein
VDRVPPLRALRDETRELRRRLEALETQITDIEASVDGGSATAPARPAPSRSASGTPATPRVAAVRTVARRKGA